MRIIITGGTGLIGTHLVEDLIDRYEVIVLSRNPAKYAGKFSSQVKLVEWDGETVDGWGQLADGAFAIINLAGAPIVQRWTKNARREILNSRLSAGRAVVAAVEQASQKPRVLIQASAVGYYGGRGDRILTEDSSAGSGFAAEVANQWENAVKDVQQHGVRLVIIRSGIVLSPDGGALPRLVLPFKFLIGGPLGSGEQWLAWIHIRDEVRAIRFLLENDQAHGAYNLMAPAPVTNEVFANKVGVVMNRPALLPAPSLALKLMLGEMSETVLEGQRAIPKRLVDAGFSFRFADAETALRDLLN